MLAFAYYLLKIFICSAVLFAYYWFFLRNKIYHVYNRYYLLATVLISVAFQLFSKKIFHQTATKTTVIKMLQVVNAGDEYVDDIIINAPVKTSYGTNEITLLVYCLVSLVFFLFLVQMLVSIFKLIQQNENVKIENFHFINTDAAKGTPFSFFQFIFWNNQIDVQSAAGNRIFKHELAHIQERHSWDKMFINLALIVFWINPFYWLVRKELSMIHEFIADKKAVEDGDTAAFAAMILEATYPQRTLFITNSFFYSPIKRRLMMLTKIKNARTSYISRLLVLPLLVFVFAAFTLKAKEIGADKKIKKSVDQLMNKIIGAKSIDSKSDDEATQSKNVFADRKITVVIDAGHGGSDGGAMNKDGIFEKDIALQLIKKIDALNTNDNIRII
ncbi:MAG: N-acetylmuramoyl-L-alanine amidase, partial [Ferruginibacter sp.]|nr:N-acetylmuramoyl-L-alanine amidase [Ferruginibacter sp.]